MRIENCVPMIALCLLLCGCGKQTAEPAADLRSVYQEMSGCEMTAEVTCEQSGLEWSATLHGTYVPGGESTVEVLEPLECCAAAGNRQRSRRRTCGRSIRRCPAVK